MSLQVSQLLPQINTQGYIIQVPECVRYHRVGRFIWGMTQFRNKDYVTIGCEDRRSAQKAALYYCRWHEVMKWISPSEVEPF